jgi:hypothetical protein
MTADLLSAFNDVGSRRVLLIAAGAVMMLLGLMGLALWLAPRRQAGAEGIGPGRRLLILLLALLMAVGTLVILSIGIIVPLATVKQKAYALDQLTPHLFAQETHLARLVQAESVRTIRELLSLPRYQDPKRLNRHEFKVCSQNGEDGIIAEIFRRIGPGNRTFVEFGSSDGSENNTALLLRQGWSGLWMDADTAAIERARVHFASYLSDGKLTILETFITAENIEDLFRQGKVPEELDLLSIDIDRNDYHVWEKISHFRPRVVIVEYNSGIPPTMSWVIPYDPKGYGRNPFGNGNGASLKALEELGAKKGYRLVGCDLCGVNSFFVRNDLVGDHFAAPYTAENHFEPFRHGRIAYPRYDPQTFQDREKQP